MHTPTHQATRAAPGSATPPPTSPRPTDPRSPHHPTLGEVFDERAPFFGTPAFFGPPIISVLGPWLLVVLMLIGPFALLLTVLLAAAIVTALVAVIALAISSPYLLLRHLRARAIHPVPRVSLGVFRRHRVGSSRLGSPQPKGMS